MVHTCSPTIWKFFYPPLMLCVILHNAVGIKVEVSWISGCITVYASKIFHLSLHYVKQEDFHIRTKAKTCCFNFERFLHAIGRPHSPGLLDIWGICCIGLELAQKLIFTKYGISLNVVTLNWDLLYLQFWFRPTSLETEKDSDTLTWRAVVNYM